MTRLVMLLVDDDDGRVARQRGVQIVTPDGAQCLQIQGVTGVAISAGAGVTMLKNRRCEPVMISFGCASETGPRADKRGRGT